MLQRKPSVRFNARFNDNLRQILPGLWGCIAPNMKAEIAVKPAEHQLGFRLGYQSRSTQSIHALQPNMPPCVLLSTLRAHPTSSGLPRQRRFLCLLLFPALAPILGGVGAKKLQSRLQQHMQAQFAPKRYACPNSTCCSRLRRPNENAMFNPL